MTGFEPFGCLFTRYSAAFAPISPNETRDLAESFGELIPLITSMTGIPLAAVSSTSLLRPVSEMAPITTTSAPWATQSSIWLICLARFV